MTERSFETYETTVDAADLITPRNMHLRFRLPAGKSIHFKAGQFIQVFIPQEGDKPRRTSYSIASHPHNTEFVELCVTHVEGGRSSTYLHSLKVGDKVTLMGPLGKFSLPDPFHRDAVFIATGSGIAPFRSMINDLIEHKTPRMLYLVFGNRFDEDIIYKNEWDALAAKNENFKALMTLSRPKLWTGAKGYVQEQIAGFVPDPAQKDFFICGLSNMINDVQSKLLSLGVPKEQIHYEKYD